MRPSRGRSGLCAPPPGPCRYVASPTLPIPPPAAVASKTLLSLRGAPTLLWCSRRPEVAAVVMAVTQVVVMQAVVTMTVAVEESVVFAFPEAR